MLLQTANTETGGRDAFEIAFVVPAEEPGWGDAVDLLREVLGIPQVVLITDQERVPEGVHTLILVANANPPTEAGQSEIWRLAPGYDAPAGADGTVLCSLPGGFTRRLPKERCTGLFPTADRDSPTPERIRHYALWLNERLCKRSDPLPRGEFREWLTAMRLLDIAPGRSDRLLEHLLSHLWRRRPADWLIPEPAPIPDSRAARDQLLANWMLAEEREASPGAEEKKVPRTGAGKPLPAGSAGVEQGPEKRSPPPRMMKKDGLANPALMIWHALASVDDKGRSASMRVLIAEVAPHCNTSLRLVAVLLSARMLGLAELAQQAASRLNSSEWWPPRGCVPRLQPGRENLLLSPLLLAWWALGGEPAAASLPQGILLPVEEKETLAWTAFGDSADPAKPESEASHALLEEGSHLISDSLLTNWVLLHRAQCSGDVHYKINAWAYGDAVEALEEVWGALCTWLQRRRGRSLLRLRPWPTPYEAALSLRYDVDRRIEPARANELIDLQAMYANAPCGSWYFRTGDTSRPRLTKTLRRRGQEVGAHVEVAAKAQQGQGVTHHCAPTSEYWRGEISSRVLAERGAIYGEFLASGLPTPRRAWLPAKVELHGPGALGRMLLTPLHFPLEGGTADRDLSYFDRLVDNFRRRLAIGGHAIIGSHPDLNQDILVELLRREDLSHVWMAPVAAVVGRWEDVMTPGAVRVVNSDDAKFGPRLLTTRAVANLCVEIIQPSGEIAFTSLQLKPGVSREITAKRSAR